MAEGSPQTQIKLHTLTEVAQRLAASKGSHSSESIRNQGAAKGLRAALAEISKLQQDATKELGDGEDAEARIKTVHKYLSQALLVCDGMAREAEKKAAIAEGRSAGADDTLEILRGMFAAEEAKAIADNNRDAQAEEDRKKKDTAPPGVRLIKKGRRA